MYNNKFKTNADRKWKWIKVNFTLSLQSPTWGWAWHCWAVCSRSFQIFLLKMQFYWTLDVLYQKKKP